MPDVEDDNDAVVDVRVQLFAFNGFFVGVEVGILMYASEAELASLKGILNNLLKPVWHKDVI